MNIIKPKGQGYELTEEQYLTIQTGVHSISDLAEVMYGYCESKVEDVDEIAPLLTLISNIKNESRKVIKLF